MNPFDDDALDQKTAAIDAILIRGPLPPLAADGAVAVMFAGAGLGQSIARLVKSLQAEDAALYLVGIAGGMRDELKTDWEGSERSRQKYVRSIAETFNQTLTRPPGADHAIAAVVLTNTDPDSKPN